MLIHLISVFAQEVIPDKTASPSLTCKLASFRLRTRNQAVSDVSICDIIAHAVQPYLC